MTESREQTIRDALALLSREHEADFHAADAALDSLLSENAQLHKSVEQVNEAWEYDQGRLYELRADLTAKEDQVAGLRRRIVSLEHQRAAKRDEVERLKREVQSLRWHDDGNRKLLLERAEEIERLRMTQGGMEFTARLNDLEHEVERLREALKDAVSVLGPGVCRSGCEGCQVEHATAVRSLSRALSPTDEKEPE